jgi:methyl-accepting chemotaxis protein
MKGLFWRLYMGLACSIILTTFVIEQVLYTSLQLSNLSQAIVSGGVLWWRVKVLITDRLAIITQSLDGLSDKKVNLTKPIVVVGNDELTLLFNPNSGYLESVN